MSLISLLLMLSVVSLLKEAISLISDSLFSLKSSSFMRRMSVVSISSSARLRASLIAFSNAAS